MNAPDTVALTTVGRTGKFDDFHVWAPHIVQRGPHFFMFYTGVQFDQQSNMRHQRIGLATSDDLINWTPNDVPVLTAPNVGWAKKDLGTDYGGSQQLRDPFVMEDPAHPGKWLMYFVAVDSATVRMAVGVARSNGDFLSWDADPNPIRRTQDPTADGATSAVESPHVFRRHGQWWMPYTVNQDKVHFIATTQADPADTVAAHWSSPAWLRGVTEGEPEELRYWHATEYLRINSKEYLAAFNDNSIALQIAGVFEADNPAADSLMLGCPETAGVASGGNRVDGLRMIISRMRPGIPEIGLRLELPSRMVVKVAIYDIAGRRRSSLIDHQLPAGIAELTWNGTDETGAQIPSGVYFAKLMTSAGVRSSKLILVR